MISETQAETETAENKELLMQQWGTSTRYTPLTVGVRAAATR